MGQAKLRGTLEQRIEQAKAREQERIANAPRPKRFSSRLLPAVGMAVMATAGGFHPSDIRPRHKYPRGRK